MFWHFWTATYIIGMLEDTKVSILTLNYMGIDSGANNLKWEWLSTIWQHAWKHFWTVTYFMGKVTVPNVSILKSQMCPPWPRKKGSGQDEALGESIEQVPKMHKNPLKQVAVLTNRDQKLYRCTTRSRSSWTRFDSQQGLMSRWVSRNTFVASFWNVYTTFILISTFRNWWFTKKMRWVRVSEIHSSQHVLQ